MRALRNPETGEKQLPHPMFDTWGAAVEHYVNRNYSKDCSYTGRDLSGRAICGRVSNDQSKPHYEILICLEPFYWSIRDRLGFSPTKIFDLPHCVTRVTCYD